jgi:hypothetical protein
MSQATVFESSQRHKRAPTEILETIISPKGHVATKMFNFYRYQKYKSFLFCLCSEYGLVQHNLKMVTIDLYKPPSFLFINIYLYWIKDAVTIFINKQRTQTNAHIPWPCSGFEKHVNFDGIWGNEYHLLALTCFSKTYVEWLRSWANSNKLFNKLLFAFFSLAFVRCACKKEIEKKFFILYK